eukprot:15294057-Alexandrium_andersonii.AAC.1
MPAELLRPSAYAALSDTVRLPRGGMPRASASVAAGDIRAANRLCGLAASDETDSLRGEELARSSVSQSAARRAANRLCGLCPSSATASGSFGAHKRPRASGRGSGQPNQQAMKAPSVAQASDRLHGALSGVPSADLGLTEVRSRGSGVVGVVCSTALSPDRVSAAGAYRASLASLAVRRQAGSDRPARVLWRCQ